MKLISFVIPCYRSEHTLPGVIEEIDTKMSEYNRFTYEVILVNDCSPDGTLATIRSLCSERPEGNGVRKGISFARNFGQHSALMGLVSQKILGSTRLLWPDFAIPTEIM